MSADADTSGVRAPVELPHSLVERAGNELVEAGDAIRALNAKIDELGAQAQRLIRERDDAHKTLRRYEDEAANERSADGVAAVLALVGGGTIVLALVCLVVLALRLAGGAP